MMNIVLVSSPDIKTPYGGPFAPLGLLYVAGSVTHKPDVRVKLVDAYSEALDPEIAIDRILAHNPDLVGVSPTSETFEGGRLIIEGIKARRPQVKTMLGGYYPTLFDELLLRQIPQLDYVLRGEVEESFPIFCERFLSDPEHLAGVPGLSHRDGDHIVRGIPQRIEDLDTVPFPDRTVVDRKDTGFDWVGYKIPDVPPIATVVSSRGCPFRCNFCTPTEAFAAGWRGRSPENVVRELDELADEGFEIVIFVENNFTAGVTRVENLCRMMIDRGLHKRIRCFTQGTLDHVPQDTLDLMHRAGFDGIYVGVESGSDGQLTRFNKVTTSRRMGDGILRAKKAHMFVISSFISAGQGETDEDRRLTYEFIRKTKPLVCEAGTLRAHPGTPLWHELVGQEDPETVEESLTRMIYEFPGQIDRATCDKLLQEFHEAFIHTFGRGKRLREFVDLLFHNPTARWFVGVCLRNPRTVYRAAKRLTG